MERRELWNELAAQLAVDSIRCSTAAGPGTRRPRCRPRTCSRSSTRTTFATTSTTRRTSRNDRFVLSKGHASPLMYAVLKAIGAITEDELLVVPEVRSPLQGHPAPVPEMPWVDVATGSLGQGLPIGLGMALAMRVDGPPRPGLGADGGLRGRGGLGLGGDGERRVPRGPQPRSPSST